MSPYFGMVICLEEKYKREHFKEGLRLAEKLKKDLNCEVILKKVRTMDEPLIKFKGNNIAQIAPRKGMLFSAYLFWKKKPNHIIKVENQKQIDTLFEEFKAHIEVIKKNKNNGTKKPKVKSLEKQKTPEEFQKEIKERIAKLSNGSKGISVPKGLMPNPKTGTVTFEIKKAVEDVKAGKVEFRADKQGMIHVLLGKMSFTEEDLSKNFATLADAVLKAKPAAAKGTYLKSVYLTTTMGPSIKIDAKQLPLEIKGYLA